MALALLFGDHTSDAWAYPGGGGTGGRLPLFEPREFHEILIITERFLNSQLSQN